MASTGGNLLQRTRCYYFYDTGTPCNKREPGSGCSAHRRRQPHPCHPGRQRALHRHASVRHVRRAGGARGDGAVDGPGGERAIPFADFHRLPGDKPRARHQSRPREMITAVELPPKAFAEALHLSQAARPAVLCLRAGLGGGGARDRRRHDRRARLALGGVAHKPWRDAGGGGAAASASRRSEASSRGRRSILRGAQGLGHNDFKIDLARRAIVRALAQARPARRRSRATSAFSEAEAMTSNIQISKTSARRYVGTPQRRVDGRLRSPAAPSMPPSSRRRAWPWLCRVSDDRQGPDHAHRHRGGGGGAGRARGLHPREPAKDSRRIDSSTQDEAAPPGSPFRPLLRRQDRL